MTGRDEFFDAIADPHRRRVLVHMLTHNPEADDKLYIGEMAPEDADLERLLIEMQHTHLPKLEEYGFIDWDRDAGIVTKGPKFDEVRPVLELLTDHRDDLPDGWL